MLIMDLLGDIEWKIFFLAQPRGQTFKFSFAAVKSKLNQTLVFLKIDWLKKSFVACCNEILNGTLLILVFATLQHRDFLNKR